MMQLDQSSRIGATESGLRKLREAKDAQCSDDGKRLTPERIAGKCHVSVSTVKRFFGGKRVYRDCALAICRVLNLKLEDVVDPNELGYSTEIPELEQATSIKWRAVCRAMLKEQQDKHRLRRQATEMGFEVNVHVPLGLVKRKQQQRRDENVELDQIYQLEREVIAKTYQHDEFLTEVIGQRQVKKNNHIAIVGEPGAGKTTLLGAIASFIQSKTEDLPICISLASLQGRRLEDYLLKTWLSEAIGLVNPEVVVMLEIENELIKQFRRGGVWLLLDGVDEMGASSPVQALTTIQQQLTDWLGQARVVLTCRLNVWDASVNNTLTGFDTYKTHEFTYEQIDRFIQEWFTCAGDIQRGEQLKAKLKETKQERIRELVKNPLRLALLCQIFYLDRQENLPETQSALYKRFTRYFYEWKQNLRLTDLSNQDELHQALGKLAIAGIESADRFRVRESLACEYMGEQLFKLACDLGWLNLVDRHAKTDEAVYAFFHANFQEYFAGIAIDDWHFFLNDVSIEPTLGTFRIFEPQWKTVILLWLGREDVETQQKEKFIDALVLFNDIREGFYRYRAQFLAAAGIAVFRDYSLADKLLALIVKWSCGEFSLDKQEWRPFLDPIQEGATAALLETNRTKAVTALVKFIQDAQNEYECTCGQAAFSLMKAALSLDKIDKGNLLAIAVLLELIEKSQDEEIRIQAAEKLGQIDQGNPIAVNTLIELIYNYKEIDNQVLAIEKLGKIGLGNQKVIASLVELAENSQDEIIRWQAAEVLGKVDEGNSIAINTLIDLIKNSLDKDIREVAAETLGEIALGNQKAIAAIVDLMENTQDVFTFWQAARCLGRIDRGNAIAIEAIVELLENSQLEISRCELAQSLDEIDKDNPVAIAILIELINKSQNKFVRLHAAEILGKIDEGNKKAITILVADLIENYQDTSQYWMNAKRLGEIDQGNSIAVAALVKSLQTYHPVDLLYIIANSLKDILAEAQMAVVVTALKAYLSRETYQHDFRRFDACYKVIWYCAQNMSYPDFYRAWKGEPSPVPALENQFINIAEQLQPAAKTYPIVINAQALEGETDTSAIAQELCNQIYLIAFPDELEIPEVSNAPQLKRLIPKIKKQLQKQNLALIVDKCEPNQEQVTFCRKLSDVLHIAWITNKPIEPPFKGFLPNQPNLLSAFKAGLMKLIEM